jgi:hypothetical protein
LCGERPTWPPPIPLRGADAVYVARRYGTTIVSRDVEQTTRGAAAIACQTPEEALDLSLEPDGREPTRP